MKKQLSFSLLLSSVQYYLSPHAPVRETDELGNRLDPEPKQCFGFFMFTPASSDKMGHDFINLAKCFAELNQWKTRIPEILPRAERR